VAPARSAAVYEKKAASTAKGAASAVETARLAVDAARAGKALAPYLSVVLGEAEERASGVMATFDSIQPPDERSDQLRHQLDDVLERTVSALGDVRITARRGQLDRLADVARPLDALPDELQRFQGGSS
jgi:hypothetical protein